MLYGREKEVQKLLLNIKGGIHTLVYGAPGAGKTTILQEGVSSLSSDQLRVVYINNCSSRRDLLESALANLKKRHVRMHDIPIQELRNTLLKVCRKKNVCLILDHLPARLHHRMQRLLEMLETCSTLVYSVTSGPGTYDLYYWKFDALEVGNLPRKTALTWIDAALRNINYLDPLKKAMAREIFRLTAGNPGAISRTLSVISNQIIPLDDPIRIRRMFVDARILVENGKLKGTKSRSFCLDV
jgi:hypothetical protein